MGLTAGIIGLPNVGKSTLFNAITKAGAEMANYPFATIDPNVGMVEVPDNRLNKIQEIIPAKRIVHTTFEFTDIAGIVKGASKGEGLGNKFLENIRQTDAIIHVVRAFDDNNITSVTGKVDPIDDIETINLELCLADLESVEKKISRIQKIAQSSKDKTINLELNILNRIKACLEKGSSVRSISFNDEEMKIVKGLFLLTSKPILYVANISEEYMSHPDDDPYVKSIEDYVSGENASVIAISAKTEEEISQLDDSDKKDFLEAEGVDESGLDKLIKSSYHLLGLSTFFTAGGKETRAWTFRNGMKAPQVAGIIHSDFERGFIKAEVVSFDDLMKFKGMNLVREAGRLRLEGKNYIVQDGDIINFRFNV